MNTEVRETTVLTLTFLIHITDQPEVDRDMDEDEGHPVNLVGSGQSTTTG